MNYYAFHIGDYKAHTSHLSLIEDLAFRRMLDLYYLTESPLPDVKKIARAICMRENIEDIQTVLDEFFIGTEEGYIHNRCEREIKAMNDKSQMKTFHSKELHPLFRAHGYKRVGNHYTSLLCTKN